MYGRARAAARQNRLRRRCTLCPLPRLAVVERIFGSNYRLARLLSGALRLGCQLRRAALYALPTPGVPDRGCANLR